jgi:hypothetical protein
MKGHENDVSIFYCFCLKPFVNIRVFCGEQNKTLITKSKSQRD